MNTFRTDSKSKQISIFDLTREKFKVKNPIRLIELFAGIGSQAMALRDIGANFEHWSVVEFDKYAVDSYNAIHGTNFKTTDICTVKGSDLGITDRDSFTYLLTRFLARTCPWPGRCLAWQKVPELVQAFFGK